MNSVVHVSGHVHTCDKRMHGFKSHARLAYYADYTGVTEIRGKRWEAPRLPLLKISEVLSFFLTNHVESVHWLHKQLIGFNLNVNQSRSGKIPAAFELKRDRLHLLWFQKLDSQKRVALNAKSIPRSVLFYFATKTQVHLCHRFKCNVRSWNCVLTRAWKEKHCFGCYKETIVVQFSV